MVGVAHGSTYQSKESSGYQTAADRIRASSLEEADLIENCDFDLEGLPLNGGDLSCIDSGNIQQSCVIMKAIVGVSGPKQCLR